MTLLKIRSAVASAAVLALLITSAAHAETYRDAARHFAMEIPAGWKAVSADQVEAANRERGPSRFTPALTFTAGFVMAKLPPRTGPITWILAYDAGVSGCANDRLINEFARTDDGAINEKDGTFGELVQSIPLRDLRRQGPLGGGVVDRRRRWIINRYRIQTGPNQVMEQLQVVHLSAHGWVQVQSHFVTDDANLLLPVFVKMNESFRFDEVQALADNAGGGQANPPQAQSPSSRSTVFLAIAGGASVVLCVSAIIVWASRREKPKKRKKKKRARDYSDERDRLAEREEEESGRSSGRRYGQRNSF